MLCLGVADMTTTKTRSLNPSLARAAAAKLHFWIGAFVVGIAVISPALLAEENQQAKDASKPAKLSWKKIEVERVFRSEGVGVGDINKDGKLDIAIGDVWYEAPDWKRHTIREERTFDLLKYSECFGCFIDDFNGDGWPDVVVVPYPGLPIYWYENPKGQPGPWKGHLLCHSCCNESPQYADLFGKGKKVLIFAVQPKGKDKEGQMVWLSPGKDPTAAVGNALH